MHQVKFCYSIYAQQNTGVFGWILFWPELVLSNIIWAATWENRIFAYAKNKDADQLRGNREADQRLFFATRIVQSLYFLNPKFLVPSYLQWLPSPVWVGPGRNSRRPVFWRCGSYHCLEIILKPMSQQKIEIGCVLTNLCLLKESRGHPSKMAPGAVNMDWLNVSWIASLLYE